MTGNESLSALRREIAARGWDRKATGRVLFELAINVGLMLAGTGVFLASDHLWVCVCGLALSTAGSMGVATNTHTSSHYATSDKRWVNELLTYLGYPLFLGLSATYWWHKHLAVHHPAPNVIGVDDDINLAPWFALTQAEIKQSRGLRRWYYAKLQWLVFPLLLAANGFHMQKSGLIYLARKLRDRRQCRPAHWIDLGALLLFFTLWVGLPVYFFAARDVIAFYLLRISLMSYAMFAVFAPGHFPAEAARVPGPQRNVDHLLLQTATTVNFRTGWLGRLICSGLEYQIEHHLFPHLSHIYYPKLSALVKELCREQGFPYRCYQWDYGVWKCLLALRTPPIVTPLEARRSPAWHD